MSAPPPAISADLWDSLIPIDADETETTEAATVTTVPLPTPSSSVAVAPTQSYTGHYQQNYAHYAQPGAYEAYRQYSAQQAQQAAQQSQFSANTSAYGASSGSHSMPQQSMARQAIANSHGQSQGALDTADVATLNDALGSAGVDLRAEEESLQRANDAPAPYRPYEADRSRKQPPRPHFDASFLSERMRAIAAQHKVLPPPPGLVAQTPAQPSSSSTTASTSTSATTPLGTLPEDTITYLALALRARLQDLVTAMVAAARHRARVQAERRPGVYEDGRAAWGVRVRGDVGRVLQVLEKVERGEEGREREERERRWEKGRAGREERERRERAVEEALGALLEGRVDEFLGAGIPDVEGDADADADADEARGGSPAPKAGEGMDLDNPTDAGSPRRRKKAKKAPVTEEEREEASRKMANAAASRAAGLGGPRRYAWLTTGLKSAGALAKAANAPPANPYAALTAFSRQAMENSLSREGENVPPPPQQPRARVYPSTQMEEKEVRWAPDADTRMRVTLRDAMFVIEKERGHGGGRGAARGWS
ncbi:hypothetical protein B0H16DRAFT_1678194 [Mycena metata]|uniref:Transcription initiation factor TFIID subunit 4 n=1 Tax=Mycena metata TaxID=1033252 RepID=A0AAD7MHM5_9AGAR|nr:hypothetical protein B0H16DRAFT_1678194 [Mycena metata]